MDPSREREGERRVWTVLLMTQARTHLEREKERQRREKERHKGGHARIGDVPGGVERTVPLLSVERGCLLSSLQRLVNEARFISCLPLFKAHR
jgi:hypothetical protein